MPFNSLEYLIFFPIVAFVFFSFSPRYRWLGLLIGSYIFYASAKPAYVLLLFACTLINYLAGILISQAGTAKAKGFFLFIGIGGSLSLLILSKYLTFFTDSLKSICPYYLPACNLPDMSLLVPLGISFYTLQALSYSIDVYQGKREPEYNLGIFALYVSFFPLILSGPIERSTRLLPQFRKPISFDYNRVASGLRLMMWGFFQKVVIADRLAIVVNQVYGNPTEYKGISLIIATFFFTFQIYCDFSGYSDIAIGTARVMGYEVMNNFQRPYFSKSIPEFWRRWHISLSTWFRDYLYIPLGGNRKGSLKLYRNIMIVFILSGFWHGANWTFMFWGVLHGFYMLVSLWWSKIRLNCKTSLSNEGNSLVIKLVRVSMTFLLISFAWIFFRAQTLSDALYIATHLHVDIWYFLMNIGELGGGREVIGGNLGLNHFEFILSILLICFLCSVHMLQRKISLDAFISRQPTCIRWPLYYCLIFGVLLLQKPGTQEFIYIKF